MADNRGMELEKASTGLLDRTLRTFRRAWRGTGLGSSAVKDAVGPDLASGGGGDHLRAQLRACLEARGGEIEARARAAALGAGYLALSPGGRRRFLEVLAEDFDTDAHAIDAAIERYRAARHAPGGGSHAALTALRRALVAPRVRLLTRFNELSLGVKFLVDLRADILGMPGPSPALRGLERDLQELLISWFDIGFLELTRITWNTPAALLEKLIEYEAVHAIRSWDDLKHRLDEDRRCYAFFHPCMPDEPLIFVQVALVDGISDNIHELLDADAPDGAPESADTAIFYSISNCQTGLAGVSFGNFLIKQVVSDLSKDLPNLKTFSTLSPIPGFRGWLLERLREGSPGLLPDGHEAALARLPAEGPIVTGREGLLAVVENPGILVEPGHGPGLAAVLEPIVMRLCARYLLEERDGERARDRVAHFHLANGARIERINWLGDRSAQGLGASLGTMVNYRYLPGDVDRNHEGYVSKGRIPAVPAVRRLLKG